MASKFDVGSSSNLLEMGNEIGSRHDRPHNNVVEVVRDIVAYNASREFVLISI